MIFFNYFFDSVHPRSLGCSSPQGNPRQTATGSVATSRLSNWLYGNGFTETKNAYAGKVVHSPIFCYDRECSNDLLLPDSRERLMTLMSASIKGAQTRRDNGTDVIAALKGAQTRRDNGTDVIAALKGAQARRDNGTDIIGGLKAARKRQERGTDIIGIMKSSETKAKKRYDSLKGLHNNPDPAALIDELFLVYAEKRQLFFKAEPGFKTRKLYIGRFEPSTLPEEAVQSLIKHLQDVYSKEYVDEFIEEIWKLKREQTEELLTVTRKHLKEYV
jgi:hypothetical protein